MPTFARVAVDLALNREYDYLLPEALAAEVHVGSRVRVPFGRRQITGTVIHLSPTSDYPKCKEIVEVVGKGKRPPIDPPLIELAKWMSQYYCCAYETALQAILPDVVRQAKVDWKERLQARLVDADKARAVLPHLQKRAKTQARVL